MRLLVVVSMYPHPGHPYSGVFNRNCVEAAEQLGHEIVVLAPRPFVPPFLKMHPRWAAYAKIPRYEQRGSVHVHRPDLVQVPRIATTIQRNQGAYLQTRGVARRLHAQKPFDAIVSFDLSGAGGLAWRLGRDLKIPSTGWAFGLDVRVPMDSPDANELRMMLPRLDTVFYQSTELRDCAQSYIGAQTLDPDRHIVLPHGIPQPQPEPIDSDTRARKRRELSIPEDAVVVLFLSRIVNGKGIHELVKAFELVANENKDVFCLIVGETPGFDDSAQLRERMEASGLASRFKLLPACTPTEVPDFHACADIFAFPSKSEGMPNALLEAMALGTPSVTFDIPPICDILEHGPCLVAAPSFHADKFADGLANLANDASLRQDIADHGKAVVQEHYDITHNVSEALGYVERLVDQPNHSPT